MGASAVEAGIADVHDGDATHSELQRFSGVVAHSDAAGEPDEPLLSGHSQHSCHCTHGHSGWAVLRDAAWRPVDVAAAVPQGATGLPLSAVVSPHLRPPIA